MSAVQPWPLGQPFPVLMTPADIMRVFQVGRTQFYRQVDAGLYKQFLHDAPTLGHAKYSGEKVQAYLNKRPIPRYGRGSRGGRTAA